MEIEEILERLFGNIQPLCDQTQDDIRYENLDIYSKVFDFIIEELIESAKWKNDNRYSANRIGEKAFEILKIQNDYITDELRIIEEQGDK